MTNPELERLRIGQSIALPDYFAGLAMQTMLENRDRQKGWEDDETIAKRAYKMAVAMMHAREIKD